MKGTVMTEQAQQVTYYDKDGNEIVVPPPEAKEEPIVIVSQQVTIVDQRFIECPEAVATVQV